MRDRTQLSDAREQPRRPGRFTAWAILLTTTALSVTSCARSTTVKGGCTASGESMCLGEMQVPRDQVDSFQTAARLALEAVSSPGFEHDLISFVDAHTSSGLHAVAWRGVDPRTVVARLREIAPSVRVATYGGPGAWLKHRFSGNLAYDGDSAGPIRINRWGLPRSAPSPANTISHEMAHRVGLTHPSSSHDFATALCEPPYVIGSLVEKYATVGPWAPSANDCPLLKVRPR